MDKLKEKTIRGGAAKLGSHVVQFFLRLGSLIIFARLLTPADFGLVAMVTAVTGIYSLFVTAGLSSATIQKEDVSDSEMSALFWINLLVGILLASLCLASAPMIAAFYQEPRLWWVTAVVAVGFVANAAGVQHWALLHRQLRFVTIAVIEITAFVIAATVSVVMAFSGCSYWALVVMQILPPAISTVGAWLAASWIPKRPQWISSAASMLRFGGVVTLNSLVVYVGFNAEKVLLGRFWGAESLGFYTRAYQLINIPNEALLVALSGVALSALSRLQSDPQRLRTSFLQCYSLVNSVTVPTTVFCALLSSEIIFVIFGPQWAEAALLFRLLAPTVLIFGIINPLSWLMLASGLQKRSLALAVVIAPLVVGACIIGLPFGPSGVAVAYSVVMTTWLVPHVMWSLYGTVISPWDLAVTMSRPLVAAGVAAGFAFVLLSLVGPALTPMLRIVLGAGAMSAIYAWVLLVVMGQKAVFLDLLGIVFPRRQLL